MKCNLYKLCKNVKKNSVLEQKLAIKFPLKKNFNSENRVLVGFFPAFPILLAVVF